MPRRNHAGGYFNALGRFDCARPTQRPLRYKELQRSLGDISQKVLTENLRQLEARGILTRTVYEQVPPRVEYKLTELGQSMRTLFDALWAWGEHYQEAVAQS